MGIIKNIYDFINIMTSSNSIQKGLQNYKNLNKIKDIKEIFQINSLMEIKPFNSNLKEIACKIKNSYILSSININKETGKYSFKKLGIMKGFPEIVDNSEYYPEMNFYESFYVQELKAL